MAEGPAQVVLAETPAASAMETPPASYLLAAVLPPSMGPPPFGDGNVPVALGDPPVASSFNGATAFRRWKLAIEGTSLE